MTNPINYAANAWQHSIHVLRGDPVDHLLLQKTTMHDPFAHLLLQTSCVITLKDLVIWLWSHLLSIVGHDWEPHDGLGHGRGEGDEHWRNVQDLERDSSGTNKIIKLFCSETHCSIDWELLNKNVNKLAPDKIAPNADSSRYWPRFSQ